MQLTQFILLILLLFISVGCNRSLPRSVAAQSSNIVQPTAIAPTTEAPTREVPTAAAAGQSAPPLPNRQPVLPPQAFGLQHPAQTGFVPNRLEMPTIAVDIPVVELGWRTQQVSSDTIFSEWDVAEFAAGWHKNSALLDSNEVNGGNVVMSGHNNILGSVFRELDQLKKGDAITVWSGTRPFVYQVDKVLIVPEKYATDEQRRANAAWIGPFAESRLTLVSCWPRDDNTHRIIVVAYPAEP